MNRSSVVIVLAVIIAALGLGALLEVADGLALVAAGLIATAVALVLVVTP